MNGLRDSCRKEAEKERKSTSGELPLDKGSLSDALTCGFGSAEEVVGDEMRQSEGRLQSIAARTS